MAAAGDDIASEVERRSREDINPGAMHAVLADSSTDIAFWSAARQAQAIRAKTISATELLNIHLARIEKHNGRLNAVVELDAAGARRHAQAADDALARGAITGPLHGVPITIKDSIDVAGFASTWGVPEFRDNRAAKNSAAVEALVAAGAIVFGKTNMPWFAQSWQTFNGLYGTTNNPWDLTRSPGGSSGGSAAAVAAGLSALELGSDSAGGLRNPAHYCGLFAHRATFGIVPGKGQSLPGVELRPDCLMFGPIARSAEDLAIALDAMAGPEETEAPAWRLVLPRPRHKRLSDFKVAVMLEQDDRDIDRDLHARLTDLADFLARSGAKVSMKARPALDFEAAHKLFLMMWHGMMMWDDAASGGLPEDYWKQFLKMTRLLRKDDNSEMAAVLRGYTQRHRDWIKRDVIRSHLRANWASFFEDYDVLLTPVAATAALPHDQSSRIDRLRQITVNGRRVTATDQWFWPAMASIAYLPATIAPAGFVGSGLPVGVQIIGAQYSDHTCIAFARMLEQEYQRFVPPPGWN